MDHIQEEKRIRQQQIRQQIEQMTNSVQMLSDKEAYGVADELVREQMGRETVYMKRENFLEGRGYVPGDQLSGRIKGAAPGEPIEKEPENKAQKKMNRQIRKQYNASKKQLQADEREQRQAFAQDVKYSFIHTQSFASPLQYDVLVDAKKWMMENPEAYAKNKEAVDAMYKDLYIADEAYGALSREARYYADVFGNVRSDREMELELDRRISLLHDRQSFLGSRLETLSSGLKSLLKEKKADDLVKETMREYTTNVDPMDWQRKVQAGAGNLRTEKERRLHMIDALTHHLTEKTGEEKAKEIALKSDAFRAQMFIREETTEENKTWNQDVAELVSLRNLEKEKKAASESLSEEEDNRMRELIRNMMNDAFDDLREEMGDDPMKFIEKYRASDEDLVRDMDQLTALGQKLQHTSDLSKYTTDRSGGTTIMAAYEEEHQLNDTKFRAMSLMLQQLATRARWLSYIYACQEGTLKADMIIPGDQSGLPMIQKDAQGEITNEEEVLGALIEKAEKRLAMADQQMKMWIEQYKEADAAEKAK